MIIIDLFPARAISDKVTKRPPSDLSWYDSISLFLWSFWMSLKKLIKLSLLSNLGTSWLIILCIWWNDDPPNLFLPSPKSIKNKLPFPFISGDLYSLISSIELKAESIKLTGLSTCLIDLFWDHDVFIERESFPTGIVISKYWQRSDTFLTALYRPSISFLFFDDAIQLADIFILDKSLIWLLEIFVITSPKDISADASGLEIAIIGLSPIVKTWPFLDPMLEDVMPILETGTWCGPIIWSRDTNPVTDLSPIVIKKLLSETEGSIRMFLALSKKDSSFTCFSEFSFLWPLMPIDSNGGFPNKKFIGKWITFVLSSKSNTCKYGLFVTWPIEE